MTNIKKSLNTLRIKKQKKFFELRWKYFYKSLDSTPEMEIEVEDSEAEGELVRCVEMNGGVSISKRDWCGQAGASAVRMVRFNGIVKRSVSGNVMPAQQQPLLPHHQTLNSEQDILFLVIKREKSTRV